MEKDPEEFNVWSEMWLLLVLRGCLVQQTKHNVRSPGNPYSKNRGLGVHFCPPSITVSGTTAGAGDKGDICPPQGVHNLIVEIDMVIP